MGDGYAIGAEPPPVECPVAARAEPSGAGLSSLAGPPCSPRGGRACGRPFPDRDAARRGARQGAPVAPQGEERGLGRGRLAQGTRSRRCSRHAGRPRAGRVCDVRRQTATEKRARLCKPGRQNGIARIFSPWPKVENAPGIRPALFVHLGAFCQVLNARHGCRQMMRGRRRGGGAPDSRLVAAALAAAPVAVALTVAVMAAMHDPARDMPPGRSLQCIQNYPPPYPGHEEEVRAIAARAASPV